MQDAAINDLRRLGEELAGALQSPWEPACVARAFSTPAEGELALTLQQWIDLDAIRSPLLEGLLPETAEQLEAAAEIFALALDDLDPDEAAAIGGAMLRACGSAFATALPMRPPQAEAGSEMADGFGTWLPMWAFLVSQCGLAPDAANGLRVDRAYALMAATRRNQGWHCAGTPYAMRDAAEKEDAADG